jgi:hypothetical protein
MYKESLFELIRKEEVIIWAGAGMSLYAGYPSGKKLGEILVETLTAKEKESIDTGLPLPDLAEEFYRLKGNNKNSLIRILSEVFLKKAETTDTHKRLAIIPHFKTIITTNYDTLFEDSYKHEAQAIYKTKHIPFIDNKKTQIFKVHGDLSEPDSIILTKTDYNNFFKDNQDNGTYWSVIRERLATNNVLFLGYNLEDPNVSVIFDRITESFGENGKECFLVAPNLPQHKVNNLLRKGIHYIDSTAEELISELLLHLKEHIISDIENAKISADTFRHFLANIDLLPELKADKDSYKVTSLKGTKDDINGIANFTFKNEGDLRKELNDFANGRKFGTFEVPEDKLLNADFRYGGLKFPDSEGIVKLKFRSNPKIVTTIDLRFKDGFELISIPIKLYGSPSLIEIHAELKSAGLIINLDIQSLSETKVKINYKHKEICRNVKEEIELFTLLKKLGDGEIFTVYPESGEAFSRSLPIIELLQNEADFFLDYFTKIKSIEQHYKIRFSNISIHSVTDSVIEQVELLVAVINGEKLEYEWYNELTMDLIDGSDENIEQLKKANEVNSSVIAHHKVEEKIDLHGHEINVGFKTVEFLESYVSNLQQIIDKEEEIVRMKSRCNKILVSYSNTHEE